MTTTSCTDRLRNLMLTPIRFSTLLALITLGSFTGCKDSGTGFRVSDDARFAITFKDNLASSGRTISVSLRTQTAYGMSGYHIISNIVRNSSHITLRIDGIQAPEASAAVPDFARAAFNLGVLPNGVYSFDVIIHGSIVHSAFTVSDAALTFEMPGNSDLLADRPVLLRVPPAIIWGRVESIAREAYPLFLDSLQRLGTSDGTLPPGDYDYFSFTSDGKFNFGGAMGMAHGQNFIYRYSGDIVAVRNLVKRFAKNYADSIAVQLSGWHGETYYTSTLRWEP